MPLMSNVSHRRMLTATQLLFRPSGRTLLRLGVAWLVAAAAAFWYLLPQLACPGQVLSCEDIVVLVAASVAYGLALGAFYTAVELLLGVVVRHLKPEASLLEPINKVVPVAATLFVVQVAALGTVALTGALPARWPWWLGMLGAFAL